MQTALAMAVTLGQCLAQPGIEESSAWELLEGGGVQKPT